MKKYFPLVGLIFFACATSEDIVNPQLVSHEKRVNYSIVDAEKIFKFIGVETVNEDLVYDYSVYSITYKTNYGNQQINASALVAIPQTDNPVPILSFQHGTLIAHNSAPSEDLSNQQPFFGLASTGYIVVIPDYIGLGASSNFFHPYYVKEAMGKSVVDAIVATKDLLKTEKANFNGDVFLAGYSEGGYATMAAHKYMEENPRGDLNLVASAPASGGYDVKMMQEDFFNLDTYDQPFYMAYVAMAYKNYYNWSESLDIYFKEPYASKLEELFNGELSGSQINQELTDQVKELLQEDVLENFDTDAKYKNLRDALMENSLLDWTPQNTMYMYHGSSDITVPYQNSVSSYDQLIENGATDITFIPLEGKTHSTGAIPYIIDVYYKFKAMK